MSRLGVTPHDVHGGTRLQSNCLCWEGWTWLGWACRHGSRPVSDLIKPPIAKLSWENGPTSRHAADLIWTDLDAMLIPKTVASVIWDLSGFPGSVKGTTLRDNMDRSYRQPRCQPADH
jgi:hypothetical protein